MWPSCHRCFPLWLRKTSGWLCVWRVMILSILNLPVPGPRISLHPISYYLTSPKMFCSYYFPFKTILSISVRFCEVCIPQLLLEAWSHWTGLSVPWAFNSVEEPVTPETIKCLLCVDHTLKYKNFDVHVNMVCKTWTRGPGFLKWELASLVVSGQSPPSPPWGHVMAFSWKSCEEISLAYDGLRSDSAEHGKSTGCCSPCLLYPERCY